MFKSYPTIQLTILARRNLLNCLAKDRRPCCSHLSFVALQTGPPPLEKRSEQLSTENGLLKTKSWTSWNAYRIWTIWTSMTRSEWSEQLRATWFLTPAQLPATMRLSTPKTTVSWEPGWQQKNKQPKKLFKPSNHKKSGLQTDCGRWGEVLLCPRSQEQSPFWRSTSWRSWP